jgi:tripartite-type tricarboxylate transporter receptor subunit TctC
MVSGTKRNASLPDVPCAAEVGLPDYTVTTWYGLWAPKGLPADVQARIVEEVNRAAAADEIKAVWASNGAEFGQLTPAQFGSFVNAEIRRWATVVKASGARLD